MRRVLILSAMLLCTLPSAARAKRQYIDSRLRRADVRDLVGPGPHVDGFGFGGVVAAGVTPNMQIVGEVGRLSDIKPPLWTCSISRPSICAFRRGAGEVA
jgi:hypothetical protein